MAACTSEKSRRHVYRKSFKCSKRKPIIRAKDPVNYALLSVSACPFQPQRSWKIYRNPVFQRFLKIEKRFALCLLGDGSSHNFSYLKSLRLKKYFCHFSCSKKSIFSWKARKRCLIEMTDVMYPNRFVNISVNITPKFGEDGQNLGIQYGVTEAR